MNKGVLLVVSGPAGVGKGTVCGIVAGRNPDIFLSVSVTSRKPRDCETDGEHYFFRTAEQIEEMIKNDELLEYNKYVNGNYYGTPAAPCDKKIEEGASVILEIDVEGGKQVKRRRPDAVMVFIQPPSLEELERRLRDRGTEGETDIIARLGRARAEMEHAKDYDYVVVNDTAENAAKRLEEIIKVSS